MISLYPARSAYIPLPNADVEILDGQQRNVVVIAVIKPVPPRNVVEKRAATDWGSFTGAQGETGRH
jgi:hypothetical protein